MVVAHQVLLDTNVVLWAATQPESLADGVVDLLEGGESIVTISVVTAWEIAIKWRTGRLPLPTPPAVWVPRAVRSLAADVLPVTMQHAVAVADLPDHHRDPFDRLLIAQARVEGLPIVTGDRGFGVYDVEVISAR